jgi:monoamine oxidase
MVDETVQVAVIGGGAAGIAAARRLTEAGVPALLIEARERLGAWAALLGEIIGGKARQGNVIKTGAGQRQKPPRKRSSHSPPLSARVWRPQNPSSR